MKFVSVVCSVFIFMTAGAFLAPTSPLTEQRRIFIAALDKLQNDSEISESVTMLDRLPYWSVIRQRNPPALVLTLEGFAALKNGVSSAPLARLVVQHLREYTLSDNRRSEDGDDVVLWYLGGGVAFGLVFIGIILYLLR
jgi:hypothetical protein